MSEQHQVGPRPARKQAPRNDMHDPAEKIDQQANIAFLQHKVDFLARRIDIIMRKMATMHETHVAVQTGGRAVAATDAFAPLNPIEFHSSQGSSKTIIAFAGMALRNGMPPREFLRSLEKTQANALLCKDFRQAWYQQGLLGASEDVPSTISVLKNALQPNQTHVGALGSSSGGYAAILFGVLMGVDKILAFGPQTQITKYVFDKFQNDQSYFSDLQKNGRAYFDLAQVLEDNPQYNGHVQIHFSKDNALDRRAAEHLSRFSCVTLYEHPGTAHGIAAELQKRDQLQPLMDWLAS